MKRLFTLMCGVLFVQFSYAQWTYTATYNADAGNPGGLNTGGDTESVTSWTSIVDGPQSANAWSPATAIPFAFDFYGTPVTHFKASQNGLVTFDTMATALPSVNENLPSATLPNSTIAGLWDEFTNASPTGGNDDIVSKVYGTAPNRQFWIKWFSFELGNPNVSFNYFAVVLEESSNKIYVVDLYRNSGALSMTVGVQLDPSTAVQFGDSTISNPVNSSLLPNNDYYEFCPLLLVDDDAGVASLINPSIPVTPGMQTVDVNIQNFGINNLDTVDISWEVDGMAQPSVSYGSTLTPGASAPVNMGMYNFASGVTNLKFWTSAPNGMADGNPANDTLEVFVCDALSGTYTIGGVGADFATLIEAVDVLVSCGISGPVTFNIAPGTYDGGITIPAISSMTNTITFDGGSADSVTVTASSGSTFLLEGADYVTLTNMTIEHTGTSDAFGVRLADTANHNTISNNIILMDPTGISDVVGIVASASATSSSSEGNNANYTMIMNNTMVGGDVGIRLEGAFAGRNVGNQIIGNDLSLTDLSGIYIDDQDSLVITGNYIHDVINATSSDGIYCFDIMDFTISENEVYVSDYGIYVSDGNVDATPIDRAKIVNNMVSSTSDYGIYLNDIADTDVWHNSSFGRPSIRIGGFTFGFSGMDIRNNIFVSDTDFAFEADDPVDNEIIDYNIYESGNANLIDIDITLHVDLASWQTATPALNVNSLQGDPGFTSITSDLHLLAALANDVGDNSVGVTVDIDGDTRPQAPSTTVDIGADEFTPLDFDATITELLTAAGGCGDSATMITVVFKNQGLVTIDSLVVSADVSGSLTQSLSATYLGSLPEGASDTIDLGMINTFAGGTFDILAYTQLAGEQDPSNDSMMYSITRATSEAPTAMPPAAICLGDSTMLIGMGEGGYYWFDSIAGGNILGQGDTFLTGPIMGPTTFYVGYNEVPDSLTTEFTGTSGCGAGNMFDLTALSNITINALTINPNSSSADSLKVWYIPNSTYSANGGTQSAWTLLDAQAYTALGSGVPTTLSITPLSIPAGATYAIYVQYDANYTFSAGTFSNADLTLTTGSGHCSPFSPINGRTFNGTIHYVNTVCNLDRTAVAVPTNPLATAGFTASSVEFDATFVDLSSEADSVYFDYGDGTTGTDTAYTYAAVGTYTVCQVAVSECGNDTTCQEILITCTPPTAGFTTASTELEATFTSAAMLADSVTYDYGDGTMGSDSTHTYAAAGTYTVCQIASSACESDTTCQEIQITCTAPTAGLSVMNEFLAIAITNSAADADSVIYDYGDGTTGTDTAHTYDSAGVYTVCQVAINDCDRDTSCAEVAVFSVGLDRIPGLTELSVFPNPNQGQFSVEAFLDRSEAFSMELHTLRGQRVYQKNLGNSNGSIREQINVQHLSKGVYFLRIQVGIHALTQKITITE